MVSLYIGKLHIVRDTGGFVTVFTEIFYRSHCQVSRIFNDLYSAQWIEALGYLVALHPGNATGEEVISLLMIQLCDESFNGQSRQLFTTRRLLIHQPLS